MSASNLFRKHFRRIVFETHVFDGKRAIAGLQTTLKGQVVDPKRAGSSPASLLPADLAARVSDARGKIYAALNKTWSCGIEGTRMVAVKHAAEFVATWTEAVAFFNTVADEVTTRRGEIYEYNRSYWLPFFNHDEGAFHATIGRHIPPAGELRARFSVHHRLEDATGAGTQFENDLVEAFFEEALENAVKHDHKTVVELATEPLKDLASTLRALRTQIDTGTKVAPNAVNASLAAAEICVTLQDIIAPETVEAIARLVAALTNAQYNAELAKDQAGGSTAYFKLPLHKAKIFAAINDVLAVADDKAAQEEMIEKFGKLPRALDYGEAYGLEPDADDDEEE